LLRIAVHSSLVESLGHAVKVHGEIGGQLPDLEILKAPMGSRHQKSWGLGVGEKRVRGEG
jgi:hypothetical protein